MKTLHGRNVNDLYAAGKLLLETEGDRMPSRDGEVLTTPYPVMSVYERPRERVLFDEQRDANPFFHLLESMWMLAGRDDGTWLDDYISDFSKRFAEDSGHIHGAYGYRWRHQFIVDQLETVVQRLRFNVNDRRVVIQMWDADSDLISAGTTPEPRDLPCNTHVYPRVVHGRLDITVMCRSNDAVWGAYGANAVHFSFLQEYLAAGVGIPVGRMYQLSNNFHIYTARVKPGVDFAFNPYYHDGRYIAHLVNDYSSFYKEVREFCDGKSHGFINQFLETVAAPMRAAAMAWRKDGASAARLMTYLIQDDPWRDSAEQWLNRRLK